MLKLLLPLLLFIPVPVLSQHNQGRMCVRTKKTVVAGHYDNYGRWHNPYTMEEDVVEPCNTLGYVPPVGRPERTEATTRPRYYTGQQYGTYQQYPSTSQVPLTRAQCRNRAIAGALAGGGTAAAVSKKDAYPWAIPLGAISGIVLARQGECADLR